MNRPFTKPRAVPTSGRYLAIRHGSRSLVVEVRRANHGSSVSSRSGVGPCGELGRLKAAGWGFRKIDSVRKA